MGLFPLLESILLAMRESPAGSVAVSPHTVAQLKASLRIATLRSTDVYCARDVSSSSQRCCGSRSLSAQDRRLRNFKAEQERLRLGDLDCRHAGLVRAGCTVVGGSRRGRALPFLMRDAAAARLSKVVAPDVPVDPLANHCRLLLGVTRCPGRNWLSSAGGRLPAGCWLALMAGCWLTTAGCGLPFSIPVLVIFALFLLIADNS